MNRKQSGDTLIEVLLATALLAFILVGLQVAFVSGSNTAMNSVERTQIQSAVNTQVSLIRYARDQGALAVGQNQARPAIWGDVIDKAMTGSPPTAYCDATGTIPSRSFYVDSSNLSNPVVRTPSNNRRLTTLSSQPVAGNGLWVEVYNAGTVGSPAIDVVVRACWRPLGGGKLSQTSTIVRLYVPRP